MLYEVITQRRTLAGADHDRHGCGQALEQSLSTFYGEPYGYENDGEDTVSIATTCFDPDGTPAASVGAPPASAHAPPRGFDGDRFGRTPLWWAARDGLV